MKRELNQLKTGTLLSYIQIIAGGMVSLVYTPIMLRALGQSEYGLYSVASSIVSYLGLLSFGFGGSYVRFFTKCKLSGDKRAIERLNGLFMIVFFVMGIAALLSGWILANHVGLIFNKGLTEAELDKAKNLIYILSVNMGISFPTSIFTMIITAHERFVFQKLTAILKTVVSPFIMLPVLFLGLRSVGLVTATLIIYLLCDGINIYYCIKKLHVRVDFHNPDLTLLKSISVFSVFIALNSVIDQINWNVDKVLLGRFRGTAGVSVYGVAATINSLYMNFSTSISSVFTPRIHSMIIRGEDDLELTKLFTKVGRVQFIVLFLICSGFFFFGKTFIYYWAGPGYHDAFLITMFLIVPVTISLIQNIGIEIQRAKNRHQFRAILCSIMALINLFISIPLCKKYGGIGCAIGTGLSLLLANGLLMNIFYHRVIHIDMFYFWSHILQFLPSSVLPILFGMFWLKYFNCSGLPEFLIGGVLYIFIYLISMWFFGFNDFEKELVYKPFKKMFQRGGM